MRLLLLLSLSLFSIHAFAGVNVPQNLDASDRIEALRILGFGTTSKVLSHPYPLGGFEGVELSLSLESINIEDLNNLGDTTPEQKTLVYPTFTVGKGLYDNFDLFVHFIPFLERTSLSEFGAVLRWGLFQPASFPASLSFSVHANSANIDNKITSRSFGGTFIGAFHLYDVAFYGGYGFTTLKGKFIGDADGVNDNGVTDSGATVTEKTDGNQFLFGISYKFSRFFASMQVDIFDDPVYSAKLGYRF